MADGGVAGESEGSRTPPVGQADDEKSGGLFGEGDIVVEGSFAKRVEDKADDLSDMNAAG